MKKILPPRLQKGDKVGIAAPAGPITEKQLATAISRVEKAGYIAVPAEGITNRLGYLAGSDEGRARQINALFADKSIKAILAARGGFGCTRILDKIDYELIKQNPKIIGGYSDLTALICAINKKTGLVT
ncbi:MAG: LD-carboxypeptidase, partial [Bacteroidales bacterium]|nr:LD-carboxypeptidase [Bacteroidales bacterium]